MHSTSHGSIGSVIVFIIFKLCGLPFTWMHFVIAWIISIAPDLSGTRDWIKRLYYYFVLKKDYNRDPYEHRRDIVHKPLTWLFLILVLSIINYFFFFLGWEYFLLAAIVVILHFLMDGFGETEGVEWLWPFDDKKYLLFVKAEIHPHEWFVYYFNNSFFLAFEIIGLAASVAVLYITLV